MAILDETDESKKIEYVPQQIQEDLGTRYIPHLAIFQHLNITAIEILINLKSYDSSYYTGKKVVT